jgi:two-component system response regulator FixJ
MSGKLAEGYQMTFRALTRRAVTSQPEPAKGLSDPSISMVKAPPEPLMVCIVDNDAAIRDSLGFLIESAGIPVATYASAREFLDTWDITRTGCLVVDIRMPGMSGLELQIELTRRNTEVPMIIITGFGDVQLAVQAMKRGAFDFFEKPIHHQLLLDRLAQALIKETAARKETAEKQEFQRRYALLSPKEREVLEHVVDGKTSQGIAVILKCAPKTVEVHRTSIYTKMKCKNLADVVRMMMLKRIVSADTEASSDDAAAANR